MPVEDGVGWGELTEIKIKHLTRIYQMHLSITQAVLNRNSFFRQSYRYIDLTAGKGYSPHGVKGSPIVFLEQAANLGFSKRLRCDLIERKSKNLEELKSHVNSIIGNFNSSLDLKVNYHQGNYEIVIPKLLGQGSFRKEFGLLFVDPSGDSPNFDILRDVAQKKPTMEILIYLSATNIKRVHHLTKKLLSDYMTEVGKKYWLIRKPFNWDSHKWTFLLGSNTDIFKNYKRIDFYRLDSERAASFFPELNLSKKQIRKNIQPSLFDDFE